MQKRGQIALFVVLGIVVVVAIIMGLFFRAQIAESIAEFQLVKSEKIKQVESDVTFHAETCLKKTTLSGIQEIFANGGYYKDYPKSISYSTFQVPYYLDGDEESIPSLKEIAKNLALFIENNNGACLQSFNEDLKVGSAEVEVSLSNDVGVDVSQTLSLKLDDGTARVKKYSTKVGFDAKAVYDHTNVLFEEVKDFYSTDLLNQGLLALQDKYKFYNPEIPENEGLVFIVFFNNTIENEKDVNYNFAIRYPAINFTIDDAVSSFVSLDDLEETEEEEEEPNDVTSVAKTVEAETDEFFAELDEEEEDQNEE